MIKRDPQEKAERNQRIYEERKAGLKLRELADRYGVNVERIRQICKKEERREYRDRFAQRRGTYNTMKNIERTSDLLLIYRKARGRQLSKDDLILLQKINNLIEVYGEEV